MRESKIEKACNEIAKANGWACYKFNSVQSNGVPDRLYIRDGKVLFVEYKKTGQTVRPLQHYVQEQMRAHGALVYVIDNIEQAHETFV